jgi:hypothetical protein
MSGTVELWLRIRKYIQGQCCCCAAGQPKRNDVGVVIRTYWSCNLQPLREFPFSDPANCAASWEQLDGLPHSGAIPHLQQRPSISISVNSQVRVGARNLTLGGNRFVALALAAPISW